MDEDTDHPSVDEEVALLDRICNDAFIRRELLWLRAMEKQDEATARDLERLQPDLREHMQNLVNDFTTRGNRLDTEAERRDGYGRLQDERYEYYRCVLRDR